MASRLSLTLWIDGLLRWITPFQPVLPTNDPWDAIHQQVRAIEVRARGQLREQFSGEFRSAFRGRGLEFSDIRAYLPGDDVRFIDWNVTARRGAPFIKQFVEEREQTVFLLVDVSASASFGTTGRSVRDMSLELAGLLGFAAALNNDRVGAAAFAGELEYSLQPRKGTRQVLRILHDLLALKPRSGGTNLPAAIEYASRLLRRGSVVFIISDFLADESDAWDVALRRLGMQHDVVALAVYDPHEAALPSGGFVSLRDSEREGTIVREAEPAGRVLQEASAARFAELPRRLRATNVDFALLPTDQPYLRPLLTLFRARTHRQ